MIEESNRKDDGDARVGNTQEDLKKRLELLIDIENSIFKGQTTRARFTDLFKEYEYMRADEFHKAEFHRGCKQHKYFMEADLWNPNDSDYPNFCPCCGLINQSEQTNDKLGREFGYTWVSLLCLTMIIFIGGLIIILCTFAANRGNSDLSFSAKLVNINNLNKDNYYSGIVNYLFPVLWLICFWFYYGITPELYLHMNDLTERPIRPSDFTILIEGIPYFASDEAKDEYVRGVVMERMGLESNQKDRVEIDSINYTHMDDINDQLKGEKKRLQLELRHLSWLKEQEKNTDNNVFYDLKIKNQKRKQKVVENKCRRLKNKKIPPSQREEAAFVTFSTISQARSVKLVQPLEYMKNKITGLWTRMPT